MTMHALILFTCGVSAAYTTSLHAVRHILEDDDPSESLAMLLLASSPGFAQRKSSHARVQRVASQPKLMNRRQKLGLLGGLAAAGATAPAFADLADQYQMAFALYGTPILTGRDYWQFKLPKLIESGNWEQIQADMAPPKDGSKKSKAGGLMFQCRRSMSNWLQTQAKPYSPIVQEGSPIIAELKAACDTLLNAAVGSKEEDGFLFFKNTKTFSLEERKEMAVKAQKDGAKAFQQYITLSNSRPLILKIDEMDD
jgi:hypothetical protein|mmetsp:Transcript_10875/g.17964  ORF Transcript_10875/g.17964 Transcript_10875/m.17964 type:complete len:254 (+) Transcript_10875:57-818(+)|eukprot:CAMPEP_0169164482 /NCGR_PEP_ID=MMETSP1015-20121227/58868_1 /TAXON_ID=342587 /ORGANISM="Karlodinium micrum, Strain CCMP2283" /LENGTH=253 /DNA_ID=CAMNT_0009236941 /DNA_START=51 /DNA_END=812 /DNA_ORIENTATION=+